MKTVLLLISLTIVTVTISSAAIFSSDSNGSYGPLNVTEDVVLDIPPDGIFHCTSINIGSNAVLHFNRNVANTPVYLLATGEVKIEGSVVLDGGDAAVNKAGKGGPGGFDGGEPTTVLFVPAGYGYGPGGGANRDGRGTFAERYGNSLLIPLIGGSGGGGQPRSSGGEGGAGGGGAMLIASDISVTHLGVIRAQGGTALRPQQEAGAGPGSGGGIRVVAPMVRGTGTINVSGGFAGGFGQAGGFGRIRIDTINDQDLKFSYFGVVRQGREMYVFPPNNPRLEIIEAGGQPIANGTVGIVNVQLLLGASTNQTVKLRAHNFSGRVSVEVRVTPETGQANSFRTEFDASTNPAEVTVDIFIVPDITHRIQAWTR
ncbi:MAG: hypothetical protein L0Z50_36860 [Verrucomicrobiales bacterium]|nr:hypothetical protein [Verrucomicrobiales bacterium]